MTGGFSRTAVQNASEAKTPLAGAVTGVLVVVSLVALTPVFFYIPKVHSASARVCVCARVRACMCTRVSVCTCACFSAAVGRGHDSRVGSLRCLVGMSHRPPHPQAALAAIIMMSVVHMIDVASVKDIWYNKPKDLIVWMASFLLCLLWNLEYGVIAAVVLSALLELVDTAMQGLCPTLLHLPVLVFQAQHW